MSDDDLSKRLLREIQPEIDRMRADHERTMRLIDAMPEPTEEQRLAISKMNSPEGWPRSIDDVVAQATPAPKGGTMRTFGIWFFGLLASAMIGGMVAHYFLGNEIDVFGALTGMAVFACARLWLASPSRISN